MKYELYSKPRITSLPHFFIQSHGEHAGRALRDPIPNSFTCISNTPEERELLYWTCEALYRSRKFWMIQRGSVIPFIALYEAKKVLAAGISVTLANRAQFEKTTTALQAIDKHIENNLKQNAQLKEISQALLSLWRE